MTIMWTRGGDRERKNVSATNNDFTQIVQIQNKYEGINMSVNIEGGMWCMSFKLKLGVIGRNYLRQQLPTERHVGTHTHTQ